MRRFFALFLLPVFALPAFLLQQNVPVIAPADLEITGINAAEAPQVTVSVNVTDMVGRSVSGLELDDFQLGGALAGVAQIVRVESVADDNLPFAVVLVIDTSSSMAGTPLQRTQAAAKAFVSSLGTEDAVALVTFDNDPMVLREFTTDKADLLAAIDGLNFGGQTALYDGALTGIELAAEAPYPRRAVILLSDGAEFGGASLSTRDEAPELSPVRGVPVYTVGLGFGLDRTYLEQLSESSSARFYESPTPDELTAIYTELASLFRSQYVLTLDFTGDLDGRIYPFTLRASNEAGQSGIDAATLRAPRPVPVVSLSPEPTAPLASPVTFTAEARGDQPITQVEFMLGDVAVVDSEAPYTLDFDPFTSAPGDYTITARATDEDGDTGELALPFSVAAIPSRVNLSTDLSALGEIAAPVTVTVSADSQTPPQSVDFRVDGTSIATAEALPADFTLDPVTLAPGPHTVEFVVANASGAEAAITQTVQIAALPPVVTVNTDGLPETITEDVMFNVTAAGQTPIETIAFTLNGGTETVNGASAEYTIRPLDIAPGAQSVTVIVTDQAGTVAPAQVNFNVGVLPPVVTIDGLADDDVLSAPRTITVTVGGQTENATVTLLADALSVAVEQAAPYEFAFDPAAVFTTPGAHLVSVVVENEFGGVESREFRVTVPDVLFPTATPDIEQTAAVESALAQSTTDAQATADAGATQQAQATADAQAVLDATSTTEAQATIDAQAVLDAAATEEAQATANVVATDAAIQTGTARASVAEQRLATTEARSTMQVQGTIDAQLTEIAQQTLSALSTENAQATLDTTQAVATQEAATLAAATAAALQAEQTTVARETVAAQSTGDALGRATVQAENTAQRQSTLDAASTSSAEATLESESEMTAVAQVEPTEEPTLAATDTPEPTLEPTIEATVVEPTPEPFDPTSTPGSPIDVIASGADTPDSSIALLAMACGVGLLILIVVVVAMARRNRK